MPNSLYTGIFCLLTQWLFKGGERLLSLLDKIRRAIEDSTSKDPSLRAEIRSITGESALELVELIPNTVKFEEFELMAVLLASAFYDPDVQNAPPLYTALTYNWTSKRDRPYAICLAAYYKMEEARGLHRQWEETT